MAQVVHDGEHVPNHSNLIRTLPYATSVAKLPLKNLLWYAIARNQQGILGAAK